MLFILYRPNIGNIFRLRNIIFLEFRREQLSCITNKLCRPAFCCAPPPKVWRGVSGTRLHKQRRGAKMNFRILSGFFVVLLLTSCTSIRVQPIDRALDLKHVCIQENPKVIVPDFLTVLREGFDRHGISTEVFSGAALDRCEYILTYTALQSWDFTTYLSHAELRLERKGRKVGYAEFHLTGKGGFSLMKWEGTRAKIDPVIDELLKGY